jgi:hypothetical protein
LFKIRSSFPLSIDYNPFFSACLLAAEESSIIREIKEKKELLLLALPLKA